MKKQRKPLIDEDGEVREITMADMKLFRPAREVDPALVAAYESGQLRYRGQRGTQKAPTKEQVTLRLDKDVLDFFKTKGAGWQTRIGTMLKAFVDAAR